MAIAQSRLTAQGQVSVPAEVRRRLGIGPGSFIEWEQDGDKLVLVELSRVLESVYELERSHIATAIEMLLDQEHLVVQDPETVAGAVKAYGRGTGSNFADCMILEVARSAGHLPLATFDRKLAKAEGAQRLR